MTNIIEITDFNTPELDVYARLTEAQLLNKDRPKDGLFIAESPKVIERALDAGYEITPEWTAGVFASFHTNHRYVGRETIQLSPTEALTTDQQHSAFQVPFGAFGRYYVYDNGYVRPYVGGKVGAMYEQNTTYLNSTGYYERPWGFYVSPELGMNINPKRFHRYGFHVAVYYSYATNRTDLLQYEENGRHNLGFRVGVCF